MKKRIGELNGKPIVIGDENETTKNEIHYSIVEGIVVLKVRKDDGKLHAITIDETDDSISTNPSDTPSATPSVTSLESEDSQTIHNDTEASNTILGN